MSFSAPVPGFISLNKVEFNENDLPATGGTNQKSSYSFVEKISAITNPVNLQHDVVYANAFAAVIDRKNPSENENPLALGCVGHQPDKEFPLESRTPIPLPLVMYPTETNGNDLHEVDMCARPVLNWEAYIKDIKAPYRTVKAVSGNERTKCSTEDKLSIISLRKLKNKPKLRIEGTWNHLYGGYNGSCCFMKAGTSKKLHLFLGKGSQLRAVELSETNPSSIFSFKIDSMWDDDQADSTFNTVGESTSDPLNELIFQIVPNEECQLLGVRRGRCIQIYDTADDSPVLLETVPNVFYGTNKQYHDANFPKERTYNRNPLLRSFDFNPTFGPEIISVDENQVVRVCNIYKRETLDVFVLPNSRPYAYKPENYPDFNINDAVGITFTNYGQLFYGWGDSVVYMGDRRAKKYSRAQISTLFDLRNQVYSHAQSSQNHFHEATTKLNEYISCVRKSERDPYYYVGTTSKIYLMDLRVPSHSVISVNHGLQSSLAYVDTFSGGDHSFETIVAGSQRSSETVCLLSDLVHFECLQKPGCKSRNPLLCCYPRHLLNSRSYFDTVVNEGYDFPYPVDYELVKSHCYAWPTGLAVYPMSSRDSHSKLPGGFLVATTNHFGDVFWQEWGQKTLQSHRKTNLSDYKLKTFLTEWHKAMKRKAPECDVKNHSKNSKKPTDCTIFLEPLAKEIEKLIEVRNSPFDCFKPDQMKYHANTSTMKSIKDLCGNLKKYKSPRVKDILDVWSINEGQDVEMIELEVDQVYIKTEPQEWYQIPSPTNTIEIDSTDNEEEPTNVQQPISQMEAAIDRRRTSTHGEDNLESFLQVSDVFDMFESSQPSNPNEKIQDFYSIKPSSSQQSFRKSQKPRRPGFL